MNNQVRNLKKPPIPTFENPHAQLDWIWERFTKRYENPKTVESFKSRLAFYKRFLTEANGYDERLKKDPRFYLEVYWDHFAIFNAEKFWTAAGYSSATIHAAVKTLRSVIHFAAEEGLTPVTEFLSPRVNVTRETNRRDAYSDEEIDCIRRILGKEIQFSVRVARGYQRTGIGDDPRGQGSGESGNGGWTKWENMVWFFENVMQCKAAHANETVRNTGAEGCRSFFSAASHYHGSVDAVWQKLGVSPVISSNLLIPLVMKLALETGLNPESIMNLKRDCYNESHPLTGLPYITYYKKRSGGEKQLHLAFLKGENQANLHLLSKQSEVIRRTIGTILDLTAPLVEMAFEEDKNYLLLFRKTRRPGPNLVGRLALENVQAWASEVKKKFRKEGSEEVLESLNLARFRATKITQMVRDGNDFFRVQAVAGHASAITTARYVAGFEIERRAQREINTIVKRIHSNSRNQERNPKPYTTSAKGHKKGTIYKGVISDCKNVFDPPNPVRKLPNYEEGKPCTYWNMCLFCPNVIITRRHLPILVSYERDIRLSLKGGNLIQVPNTAFYQKALAVIEDIFNEFPEEQVTWAKNLAESADFYTDSAVYREIESES